MAIEILMPALSPTMTEGKLARWVKKEGEAVRSGEVLAEIETDKATMEVEAVDEGIIGRILVPEGAEGVKVNQPIALLVQEGEAVPTGAPPGTGAANGVGNGKAGLDTDPAHASGTPQVTRSGEGTAEAARTAPIEPVAARPTGAAAAPASTAQAKGERIIASPLAKRIAKEAGLDLAGVKGSGPHGRIIRADVEAALAAPRPAAPKAAAPAVALAPVEAKAPPPAFDPTVMPGLAPYELVPHSSMRRTIARRLTESYQTVPHFFLTIDCRLDDLLKLRADLNARGEAAKGGAGFKLSVNDFIVKAAALALKRMPEVNAAWSDQGLLRFTSVDVAVAVALPAGLITPILRGADRMGLAEISNGVKELADRAKAGKLKPEEYQGGTFSISNLGMFGIKEFTAIINPPQSCILAVGAGEQRAVVKGGALAVETVMSCTMSCDHRVVDGALGAQWLQIFKALIEDPLRLML